MFSTVLQPSCFQLFSVSVPLWKWKTKFHNHSKLHVEHAQTITAAALQTISLWKYILGMKSSARGQIPMQKKSGGTFIYLLWSKEQDF